MADERWQIDLFPIGRLFILDTVPRMHRPLPGRLQTQELLLLGPVSLPTPVDGIRLGRARVWLGWTLTIHQLPLVVFVWNGSGKGGLDLNHPPTAVGGVF